MEDSNLLNFPLKNNNPQTPNIFHPFPTGLSPLIWEMSNLNVPDPILYPIEMSNILISSPGKNNIEKNSTISIELLEIT
jgi:hypothetical protein